MATREKIGILLILIGFGIPLVLYFFQDDGVLWTIKTHKQIQRNLNPDEVAALREIVSIKKDIAVLEPHYDIPYIKPKLGKDNKGEWILTTESLWGTDSRISFKEYTEKIIQYEMKFVKAIKTAYAQNHFEHEAWHIDARKQIEIPFRQVVGIGVFLVLTGLGFLIFSRFSNKEVSR